MLESIVKTKLSWALSILLSNISLAFLLHAEHKGFPLQLTSQQNYFIRQLSVKLLLKGKFTSWWGEGEH